MGRQSQEGRGTCRVIRPSSGRGGYPNVMPIRGSAGDKARLASVDLINDHSSFEQWKVGEAGHRLEMAEQGSPDYVALFKDRPDRHICRGACGVIFSQRSRRLALSSYVSEFNGRISGPANKLEERSTFGIVTLCGCRTNVEHS